MHVQFTIVVIGEQVARRRLLQNNNESQNYRPSMIIVGLNVTSLQNI